MMDWGSLPLLPLGCVWQYLCTKDALAASAVCRQWRTALHMFGGRKDTLKLHMSDIYKCCFLTRVFKRNVKQIQIYVDSSSPELQYFMSTVFTQFHDMKMLREVIFIGPIYTKHQNFSPVFKLKRKTLESLPFSNLDSLVLMGCTLSPLEPHEDEYVCVEPDCEPGALSFSDIFSPVGDITSGLTAASTFSTLRNLTIEYDHVTTDVLTSLSQLEHLKHLNINITLKTDVKRKPLEWHLVKDSFPKGLYVCVNMISVPEYRFKSVMSNVLVEALPLASMKVMFCKTLYFRLLRHLSKFYKSTLRELVWVDSPFDPILDKKLLKTFVGVELFRDMEIDMNPLVLLCWQCNKLQRLVLHGYWVWHYDLVGCVRLRSLLQLDVSAVEVREAHYLRLRGGVHGYVLTTDSHNNKMDRDTLNQINKYMSVKWKPRSWSKQHPAVRGGSRDDALDYVLREANHSYSAL